MSRSQYSVCSTLDGSSRATCAPNAPVPFAGDDSLVDCRAQQWNHGVAAGLCTIEQPGVVHRDPAECAHVLAVIVKPGAFQREIAARVVIRVGHQHQVGIITLYGPQARERVVGEDVAVAVDAHAIGIADCRCEGPLIAPR